MKWDPPLDTGGGTITKYNILVRAKSKEDGKENEPINLILSPKQAVGRAYTIKGIMSYSNISVTLREGGGDKSILGSLC